MAALIPLLQDWSPLSFRKPGNQFQAPNDTCSISHRLLTVSPDHGQQFLLRERCGHESTAVAALLGGSRIYRDSGKKCPQHSSDWDGALLLATKLDIVALVNEHRQTLVEMFDITREECPRLRVPDQSSD